MSEEIEILIDQQGNVKVSGKGIKGPDCEKLTAAIETALGDVVTKQRTAEFTQAAPIKRTVSH